MTRQVYDIFCPYDHDKVCPTKAEQVADVTGDSSGKTALPEQDTYAELLLTAKLNERDLQGRLRGCNGPENMVCPVREEVNKDPLRRVVVDSLRGIVRFLRKQNA